jgi:hypothetical protein
VALIWVLASAGWAGPGVQAQTLVPGVLAADLDRPALVDLGARLADSEGRPARFVSPDPGVHRVLADLVEGSSESQCVLIGERGDDLRWTLTVAPGAICRLETPGPAARWSELHLHVAPTLGNRGLGAWGSVGASWWWRHEVELGGQVWGTTEAFPGYRAAAGGEASFALAAGSAVIRIHPGFAVNWESRRRCDSCDVETRGPLWGPTLSGQVGVRRWSGSSTAIEAGLRVGSVPGRGFLIGAVLGGAFGRAAPPKTGFTPPF